jgi:hypothetical protein
MPESGKSGVALAPPDTKVEAPKMRPAAKTILTLVILIILIIPTLALLNAQAYRAILKLKVTQQVKRSAFAPELLPNDFLEGSLLSGCLFGGGSPSPSRRI